jgi:bacillithiol system protein YtxJ
MNWNALTETEQIEDIKKKSFETPILVFKHSTRCSISSTALSRLERNWNTEKASNLQPYLLDLIAFRSISNQLAQDFEVFHESPQALLIKDGACVYHASHYDISFDDLIAH